MNTTQPEALQLAECCEHGYPLSDEAIRAAAELRRLHAYCQELESQVILDCMTHVQNPAGIEHVAGDVSKNGAGLNMSTQHARITELESQLAQRFDAAAHGPTSGAADLPEALRVPLDSLHADAGYLCGRLLNGSLTQEQVVESIRRRIDAAKLAALTAQAISAEPAEHVQNPAENEHVAGDVSKNGAGLNTSTKHARITELEAARFAYASEFAPTSDGDPDVSSIHANIRALKAQLAQRFDAADMATAAAQGFRDGVASVSAGSEPVASYAIRLLVAAALITQAKADEALRLAAEITAAPGPADGESNG